MTHVGCCRGINLHSELPVSKVYTPFVSPACLVNENDPLYFPTKAAAHYGSRNFSDYLLDGLIAAMSYHLLYRSWSHQKHTNMCAICLLIRRIKKWEHAESRIQVVIVFESWERKKFCFILIQVEVQFKRYICLVSIVQYEMTGLSDFYLWNVTQQITNHTF